MPARETAGEDRETLSDQDLIKQLAAEVGAAVGAELELQRKQLDHLDEMLRGLVAFVDQHRPLLDRFAKWAGAGRGWRSWNGAAPKQPGT
jgi:hypothetical protein